jgi:superfamily I DNA and/or RNA helicase
MSLIKELIYIDGINKTDTIESYRTIGTGYLNDKYVITYKNTDKTYTYSANRVSILPSAIYGGEANKRFCYLRQIAETVGLKTDEGNNILADYYNRIEYIPPFSILANFLNQRQPNDNPNSKPIFLFPFGFNLSQEQAVYKAFLSPLSVIEGPPGTGKTQTILNIIANAVVNGQSVAVVSSNNSATKNVYEKLQKNGVEFIAALLGNATNRREFIDSQTDIPDLTEYQLSEKEAQNLRNGCETSFNELTKYLGKKNELALLNQELESLTTEHRHFLDENPLKNTLECFKNKTSDQLLALWITLENQPTNTKIPSWLRKLFKWFRFRKKERALFELPTEKAIILCQSYYYLAKIDELKHRQTALETSLQRFSFDQQLEKYTQLSMQLFKSVLHHRYQLIQRENYELMELHTKSEQFLKDYPVIMSTTYSLRNSLAQDTTYDFVIIDESSQVDLATGALALSCAKRAVIVGDLKQLPNVVDDQLKEKTDQVFKSFSIPEFYRYSNHSLLASVLELFPQIPKTLLREHYRCHPKIIEFCNQKFYDHQLIIHTTVESDREPLIVYRTAAGNHARARTNQRQIDTILHEIIPNEALEGIDLGIVTPYRNQTNALQQAFHGTTIKADTVDKFQGRENDVIILSTVDNEITDFTDNPNRLNVAISRAIKQLILVVNGNDSDKDSNIADLIRYIDYHNFSIKESRLQSVFDYLYKGYEQKRAEILSKRGRKSDNESENLMYVLIANTLQQERFTKFEVALHVPLRNVIRDFTLLSDEEARYARHYNTHLDFLIYDKFGKNPVMAIEVDGFEFHKAGTEQFERDRKKDGILDKYGLVLMRFGTTGSGEKKRLVEKLEEIIG